MLEPPRNFVEGRNYMIYPRRKARKDFKNLRLTRRMAFSVCHIIKAVNEAAIYFKQQHCDSQANFNKTFTFFENMEMEVMN